MQTHQVNTNMRQAFIGAAITKQTGAALVNMCSKAVLHGAGVYKERGWNASLSFTTAKKLNAPEFVQVNKAGQEMAPRMHTRYDAMCMAVREEE